MEDATDDAPAVDSANEESVAKAKARHVKIPPPKHVTNGIKGNSISPQPAAGKQSRPQSANRGSAAPVRYFILKSYNRENVERSIDQGVWSTQVSISSTVQESHLYSRLMDRHVLVSGNLSLLATGHVMARERKLRRTEIASCTVSCISAASIVSYLYLPHAFYVPHARTQHACTITRSKCC